MNLPEGAALFSSTTVWAGDKAQYEKSVLSIGSEACRTVGRLAEAHGGRIPAYKAGIEIATALSEKFSADCYIDIASHRGNRMVYGALHFEDRNVAFAVNATDRITPYEGIGD